MQKRLKAREGKNENIYIYILYKIEKEIEKVIR